MPIPLRLSPFPFTSFPQSHYYKNPLLNFRPFGPPVYSSRFTHLSPVTSAHRDFQHSPVAARKPKWENVIETAATLYPLYVTVGGALACVKPSTFAWFVQRGPASYSLSLGFIMLAMGLTLELNDLFALFMQRPRSILFGIIAQYTIMPICGVVLSKVLGLPPSLSAGLILLSCCSDGTASNVVTLIAQGDVLLSVVMTLCTTLGAVLLTPLLTLLFSGTYAPIDAVKLSISTLQVVVFPILLGSFLQVKFPGMVKLMIPFAPLSAVLASSLVACSVFSENIARFQSSMMDALVTSQSSAFPLQSLLSGDFGSAILSVLLLHLAGFFVGYLVSALCGFKERQRRAISIEVGMQNSSLGVVLATAHFSSPMVALPPAMSAVIMNIMGSSLGFFWRYMDPSDSEPARDEKEG